MIALAALLIFAYAITHKPTTFRESVALALFFLAVAAIAEFQQYRRWRSIGR